MMGFIYFHFRNLLKTIVQLLIPPPLPLPPLQRKKVTFPNFKPAFQVILRTFDFEIYSKTPFVGLFVINSLIFKAQKLDLHKT